MRGPLKLPCLKKPVICAIGLAIYLNSISSMCFAGSIRGLGGSGLREIRM